MVILSVDQWWRIVEVRVLDQGSCFVIIYVRSVRSDLSQKKLSVDGGRTKHIEETQLLGQHDCWRKSCSGYAPLLAPVQAADPRNIHEPFVATCGDMRCRKRSLTGLF